MELFRKRLIPDECVKLKDDIILYKDQTRIVTKWETLHAKLAFSHGMSLTALKRGLKSAVSSRKARANATSIVT